MVSRSTSSSNKRPAKPSTYSTHLTLNESPLCPHCLTWEQLHLSKSLVSSQQSVLSLPKQDLKHIFEVMSNAWAKSMCEAYSSRVLAYHVYCDKMDIPEEQWAPTSQPVIVSFIASMAGACSGASISNYIYSIHAWHILHGLKWELNQLDGRIAKRSRLNDCQGNLQSKRRWTLERV